MDRVFELGGGRRMRVGIGLLYSLASHQPQLRQQWISFNVIFNGHASATLLHSVSTISICVIFAYFTVSINHYSSVLDLPVALDQITRVTSKSRKHSLSSEVADGPASSSGLCSHQTELSMANAERKQSTECGIDEGPRLRLATRVFAFLIAFPSPIGSVQLSKQRNCEDKRHVLREVELRTRGDIERIVVALGRVCLVAHVSEKVLHNFLYEVYSESHAYVSVVRRWYTMRFCKKM